VILVSLLILLVLIAINGVLAASELSVVSARPARLQARADQGSRGAGVALDLAAAPDRFLSTVQIGITLVGILAGAFGGAALSEPIAGALSALPVIGSSGRAIAVVIVVSLITYLSLVLGELVPKRLALNALEGIAIRVARPMRALSRAAAPAVTLLAVSSDAVLRLIGARPSSEPAVTEAEVEHLLRQGAKAGIFAEAEREMVSGVFRLGDRRGGELMTPRRRIVALDVTASDAENRQRMATASHSYFPVCDGSIDQILGVVSVKELWRRTLVGEATDPRAAMTEPLFVPESALVLPVMESFQETGVHVAIVIDEYGGIEGLLTLNDVLEALVGDLEPEGARHDARAVRRDDGSWLLDGELPAHEARLLLEISSLPGEDEGDFETLGGFIMARLGRIPATGDAVRSAGYRFEVVDMDGNRVDKVLVDQVRPRGDDRTPN